MDHSHRPSSDTTRSTTTDSFILVWWSTELSRLKIGGRRAGGEVDGLCEPRVLRAPQHAGRGARTRARACQRALATASPTAGDASSRMDPRLC